MPGRGLAEDVADVLVEAAQDVLRAARLVLGVPCACQCACLARPTASRAHAQRQQRGRRAPSRTCQLSNVARCRRSGHAQAGKTRHATKCWAGRAPAGCGTGS